MANFAGGRQRLMALAALVAFLAAPIAAVEAQVQTIDPNTAIDADLNQPAPPPAPSTPLPEDNSDIAPQPGSEGASPSGANAATVTNATETAAAAGQTFRRDDLIGAAEGVFGRGAEGLARMIEDILREQGEPNGYIVGREAGGALVVGLRYGSGTLHHRIEGTMPVYWTGPSVGFDAGANAGNTFVLVYNLHDTGDLYRRYPAGEGAAYLVGGFNGSYLRRGDIVLIPIRLGVGVRLGANVGYMNFSRRQRWLPF
jgi:hypothetical protein